MNSITVLCKGIINNTKKLDKKINEMKNKPCSQYQIKIGDIIFTYSTYPQNSNCLSKYVWRINFSSIGIVIISDDNWDNISEIYYRNMKLSYYSDSKSYTLKVLLNKTNFIDNNYQYINTDYILYTNKYLEVFDKSLCFNYQFKMNHTNKDIMYLSFPKSRGKNWKVSTISYNTVENPNTICKHEEKCVNFKYKHYHSVSNILNDIFNKLNIEYI